MCTMKWRAELLARRATKAMSKLRWNRLDRIDPEWWSMFWRNALYILEWQRPKEIRDPSCLAYREIHWKFKTY